MKFTKEVGDMNYAEKALRQAETTLGPYCENCGWWTNCMELLTEDERKVQYASCFERDEPCFVFSV
jgi:hypothetical protein